jgi:hypothetical protein
MRTLLVVAAIRAGLWVLPFRVVRRLVPSSPYGRGDGPQCSSAEAVALVGQHVNVASRYVPVASCLTQALSAQMLLARRGVASTLHIGVAKSTTGLGIRAHAWLISEGTIVTGGDGMEEFQELASMSSIESQRQ